MVVVISARTYPEHQIDMLYYNENRKEENYELHADNIL